MFDYVAVKINCPFCKKEIDGIKHRIFQSKDSTCSLGFIPLDKVDNFYSSCPHCKRWVEFNRKEKTQKVEIVPFVDKEWEWDYRF